MSIWGNRYTYETVLLSRSTPQARVLAFSYTYSVVGRIPAAVLQVRDASRNGAPVCVDAFTVLR